MPTSSLFRLLIFQTLASPGGSYDMDAWHPAADVSNFFCRALAVCKQKHTLHMSAVTLYLLCSHAFRLSLTLRVVTAAALFCTVFLIAS